MSKQTKEHLERKRLAKTVGEYSHVARGVTLGPWLRDIPMDSAFGLEARYYLTTCPHFDEFRTTLDTELPSAQRTKYVDAIQRGLLDIYIYMERGATHATAEHREQVPEWRQRWIEQILSTDPIDTEQTAGAIDGLYDAAEFAVAPVAYAPSVLVGAVIQAISEGDPDAVRVATKEAVRNVPVRATRKATNYQKAVGEAIETETRDTTEVATSGATRDATDAATTDASLRELHRFTLEWFRETDLLAAFAGVPGIR